MRIAAIDIGTNTVLLLVADVDERGTITPVHHEQRLPRLGRDVDRHQTIHTAAFDRIAWILNEYKNLAAQLRSDRIVACGTSAVRDATNRQDFLSYLRDTTGISVEILTGDDEALLMHRGALSGFSNLSSPVAVIDIGGGSTEISYPSLNQRNGHIRHERYSLQVGSVRLTERFFKHNPPEPEEVENAMKLINAEFGRLKNGNFGNYQLVGVAGTVTTLACLDQRLMEFDITKVSGYTLERERVGAWFRKLCKMTNQEIRSLSNTTEGRADILLAGVLILDEIMNHFGFTKIIASERGLRYGLILREWERTHSSAHSE
ncbi:MAG: Ppx/GppA family phosphatase [Ignavibacteria bacterium]|nr:Ppx/GppA family phosphatase [Ignavibacteria bacterium]MBI3766269.1 Ppx/GppA family phosphatase [Ignavibacteriales bacterium]